MISWSELYNGDIKRNGGLNNYYLNKISNRKKLISKINSYAKNKNIAEAGCGTGVLSVKLASIGNNVYAIDESEEMLQIVSDIAKINGVNINLINKDIFKLNKKDFKTKLDVIFSVGVFEHFNDEDIIKLLKLQLSLSNYVFLAIPTMYFNESEKLYGNERFMPYSKWRKLINTSGEIIEEFSCQNQKIIKRLLNYKKYFKPAPIRVFVIKEK